MSLGTILYSPSPSVRGRCGVAIQHRLGIRSSGGLPAFIVLLILVFTAGACDQAPSDRNRSAPNGRRAALGSHAIVTRLGYVVGLVGIGNLSDVRGAGGLDFAMKGLASASWPLQHVPAPFRQIDAPRLK